MVISVETFHANVLARNRWDADRGATLKTFFVGQCLFQLPDVYQRWRKSEALQPDGDLRIARDLEERGRRLDAGAIAVNGVHAREALDLIGDEETKAMFELIAGGFSYDEIADMLDVSEAVVRTRISTLAPRCDRRCVHESQERIVR